jgi:nucleoside-diphosphate-sugar epimerase
MKRVLVTGAGGYIGTTLVPMLLEKGYVVRAVDRYFFGEELMPGNDNLELIQEDCRFMRPEFFEGVDGVVDLVAISNDPSGELFQQATWQINHECRARTAKMAKQAGVRRYVLPSSCSIYGFQEPGVVCTETQDINPLTTYAKANGKAEDDVRPLGDDDFTVVVLRQSTVFGYSPRMRFDLAINGMTYGAWKTGKLPLLRDGTQWRPMVHVRDTASAQIFMLEYEDASKINGEIFNVGSAENNYQLKPLAETVADAVPRDVEIEWYGEPDHRSYQVDFAKIEALGWKAQRTARDAVAEICERLEAGDLDKTARTITLQWYKDLCEWYERIQHLEMHGGMINLETEEANA